MQIHEIVTVQTIKEYTMNQPFSASMKAQNQPAKAIMPELTGENMKSTNAYIPKPTTFDLEAGEYTAQISGVKITTRQSSSGPEDWIRLLFDVKTDDSRKQAKAGRNFLLNLHEGSDLRNFLEELLGRKFFEDRAGEEENLQQLVGLPCAIEIVHKDTDRYEKPFCLVARIRPAKTQ